MRRVAGDCTPDNSVQNENGTEIGEAHYGVICRMQPRILRGIHQMRYAARIRQKGEKIVNFMKEVAEVEEGKRCDCCGQLITTPLWDMPYGSLCDECSKRLTEQVHGKYETPWQKVEQGRGERSTPWWFDL